MKSLIRLEPGDLPGFRYVPLTVVGPGGRGSDGKGRRKSGESSLEEKHKD